MKIGIEEIKAGKNESGQRREEKRRNKRQERKIGRELKEKAKQIN